MTEFDGSEHSNEDPLNHPVLSNFTVCSRQLLRGLKKITIDHEGAEYTLQVTRQNKLLLTK